MDSPIPDWDYIIVGAGSAGCVLANRLSADPRKTVLLLEAGESDRNPLQRIPLAGVMLNYGHQRRDWRYETEPDPSRHDRRETWPRGKLLGGTSSLNGMIYVRGAPEDFDHWASLGNDGWRYEDVLPIYKQLEDHEYSRSSHPLSHQYGSGGPLKVRQLKGVHPLARAFVSACRDLGIPENDHYNAGDQEGACILTASHSGRIRSSSSQSFLQPARHRPNLHIVTDTLVLRVLLEGKRAVGVMAERKGEGQREYRGRTVILSGGAVNSPQLLLLSGIGPAAHLQRMGIAVRHDLPGVGRNLQDHPGCAVLAKVNVPTPNTNVIARMKDGLNWLLLGKGLFTTAAAQALVFAKSSAGLRHPDIQINLMPLAFTVEKGRGVEFIDSTMTLLPNISHPKSRGFLELRSPDPHAPPSIQPNMLGAEEDVRALAVAARLGQQLLKTDAFKPYVEREILPGQEFATDAEWENYLRENATSCAHQSGTCKMGSDVMAVVDSRLKVHGIEGLRVADASIMPTVPSGNTNGVCMMIGGKAAQMILRESN